MKRERAREHLAQEPDEKTAAQMGQGPPELHSVFPEIQPPDDFERNGCGHQDADFVTLKKHSTVLESKDRQNLAAT